MLIGAYDGRVYYCEQQADRTFARRSGSENPFNGIEVGSYACPQLVDFERDGDLEPDKFQKRESRSAQNP